MRLGLILLQNYIIPYDTPNGTRALESMMGVLGYSL